MTILKQRIVAGSFNPKTELQIKGGRIELPEGFASRARFQTNPLAEQPTSTKQAPAERKSLSQDQRISFEKACSDLETAAGKLVRTTKDFEEVDSKLEALAELLRGISGGSPYGKLFKIWVKTPHRLRINNSEDVRRFAELYVLPSLHETGYYQVENDLIPDRYLQTHGGIENVVEMLKDALGHIQVYEPANLLNACSDLETARRNLSITLNFGERYAKRTRKHDVDEMNSKLGALAGELEGLAKQLGGGKTSFEFLTVDTHAGDPDISPHPFILEIKKKGEENLFAIIWIWTDNRGSEAYDIARYHPDSEKPQTASGRADVMVAQLKEIVADMQKYDNGVNSLA